MIEAGFCVMRSIGLPPERGLNLHLKQKPLVGFPPRELLVGDGKAHFLFGMQNICLNPENDSEFPRKDWVAATNRPVVLSF